MSTGGPHRPPHDRTKVGSQAPRGALAILWRSRAHPRRLQAPGEIAQGSACRNSLRNPGGARRAVRQRQGGWAGLVLLLIALVIAGWLARVALRQLTPADPATPAHDARAGVTSTAPATAIQRAQGVETEILKRAEDVQQRIDATEK